MEILHQTGVANEGEKRVGGGLTVSRKLGVTKQISGHDETPHNESIEFHLAEADDSMHRLLRLSDNKKLLPLTVKKKKENK